MSIPASGGAAAAGFTAPDDDPSPPSGDSALPSASVAAHVVHFTSGNPRIEETHGIVHLYPTDPDSSSNLPLGRKPLICVPAVPNHMTYADFCRFCASFIQHMLEMRIVRNDGVEDQYTVILRLDDQGSADGFYRYFNGKRFSSLEVDACRVLFIEDLQYTGSLEHAQSSLACSVEQLSCPVCLERLDEGICGILTTICNHSFHCSCISKWTDSSCPVCRYCQQQLEKLTCFVCGITESLRMCVICGFIGCTGNAGEHARIHWIESQHCYSLELEESREGDSVESREPRRVWDYAGDNYVHRLVQSKTDGKLVELNSHCTHADGKCWMYEYTTKSGVAEDEFNSKLQAIHNEYHELLEAETVKQRRYFESHIQEVREENEKEISNALEKALSLKLQRLQSKVDKCVEEKMFLDEINKNIGKNLEMWKSKVMQTEQRELAAIRSRERKIQDLEEQLHNLMLQIESPNAEDSASASQLTRT